MTVGERIYYCRLENHMTQKELGEKTGIDSATIGKYERGVLNPKISTLRKIADALGCDVADLDETLAITADEILQGLRSEANKDEMNRRRMNAAYSKLNQEGRAKAAERVEELTEIARYLIDTSNADTPQNAPTAPVDKDPTQK